MVIRDGEVQLADPASEEQATAWWEELTTRGGEGMVVKPKVFIARGKRGLVQPAVKCRGLEYLRIIAVDRVTVVFELRPDFVVASAVFAPRR